MSFLFYEKKTIGTEKTDDILFKESFAVSYFIYKSILKQFPYVYNVRW